CEVRLFDESKEIMAGHSIGPTTWSIGWLRRIPGVSPWVATPMHGAAHFVCVVRMVQAKRRLAFGVSR
ncbi:MAG: hypothetical protein R3C99_19850, partial [Pirellulaceae bacterium]